MQLFDATTKWGGDVEVFAFDVARPAIVGLLLTSAQSASVIAITDSLTIGSCFMMRVVPLFISCDGKVEVGEKNIVNSIESLKIVRILGGRLRD